MASISIVLKNDSKPKDPTVKHILTYNSDVIPRIGEYVEIAGHPTCEVDRVIHAVSHKDSLIIVEVKK